MPDDVIVAKLMTDLYWWSLKNPPICQNKFLANISSYMVFQLVDLHENGLVILLSSVVVLRLLRAISDVLNYDPGYSKSVQCVYIRFCIADLFSLK